MFEECNKWMKFVVEATRPITPPTFATENEVVLETDAYRLRRFSEGDDSNPVLILPPQAGHHSNICDFSSENSLVGTFLKNGVKSVYALDWKSATHGRAGETLETLMMHTERCVSHIGRKVNLVGLCQGGWQGTMYTALFKHRVNSLVLAGSPIDAHAEPGKIKFACDFLPFNFFETLVTMGGGIYRGEFQLLAFKMMNPYERFFKDYYNLYMNIDDSAFLERHHRFRNWYESVNHLPGGWYLQIVDQLFIRNNLIKGKMTLLNKKIDLKNIDCPLYMIAGSKDDITTPGQVFNAGKYVSTPPERMERYLVDSGHVGLFMGRDSLKTAWPKVIEKMKTCCGNGDYEHLAPV
jgi:poly(3-hydroxybutyrate) depolymerase